MATQTLSALVAPPAPAEQSAYEPICCPIDPDKLIARIDTERRRLYLWCKSCKTWHVYDLEELEQRVSKSVSLT